MIYKVVIPNWTSGLNELLKSQERNYNPRTKRVTVHNNEKVKNERLIRTWASKAGLGHVKFSTPISIHYHIFAKDKKHDKMNMGACLDKCFCDAMQEMGVLSNDGWNEIWNITFEYDIDRNNPRAEITIKEIGEII